jgi:hypothetical protein
MPPPAGPDESNGSASRQFPAVTDPAKGYDFAASSAAAACAWSELGPLPETNTVLR